MGVKEKLNKIKIIVPFKNERPRISGLLEDLLREFSRVDTVQIFFVDDQSDDETSEFILDVLQEQDIHFSILPNFGHGKKMAITTASQFCSLSDAMLTLDADVRLPIGYGKSLLKSRMCEGLNVLSLDYPKPKSILEGLVKLESLQQKPLFKGNAITHRPSLCSGAHLLYKASFFEHVQPYESNKDIRSGDDMFFLDACLKNRFNISSGTLSVETEYPPTWTKFIRQRRRWLSKSLKLKSKYYHKSLLMFLWLLFMPIVLFYFKSVFGFIFLGMRAIIEVFQLIKYRSVSALMLITLPIYWIWQFALPVLYIFGRTDDEQTW